MATFRKRSNSWQARIQRAGHPDISKTFKTHADAVAWARSIEVKLDSVSNGFESAASNKVTLAELLEKYKAEITPLKSKAQNEVYRISAWIKSDLAHKQVGSLSSKDFAQVRDLRVAAGISANTIRLDFAVVSNMFELARTEWGYVSLENPIKRLKMPKLPQGRSRRVSDEEISQLLENSESKQLSAIVLLAVETGMRRSEILKVYSENISFDRRVMLIPMTKNGESRVIPLSQAAIILLKGLVKPEQNKVFEITAHAITQAFNRACRRASIEGLCFHDLRHEAISRFFEKGLLIPEVAAISGHKTWAMLTRYTHLSPDKLALKL